MSIYTRTGDSGQTGLFGGGRVPKDAVRVAAYGAVDELNAVIGLAAAEEPGEFERGILEAIQRDLFSIGGQLATPDPAKVAKAIVKAALDDQRIPEFERLIDRAEEEMGPLTSFVLPGGSLKAAHLHHARTVCRRAEREVVALTHTESVPDQILAYLNRLSDLLFTLARLANHRSGVPDRTW